MGMCRPWEGLEATSAVGRACLLGAQPQAFSPSQNMLPLAGVSWANPHSAPPSPHHPSRVLPSLPHLVNPGFAGLEGLGKVSGDRQPAGSSTHPVGPAMGAVFTAPHIPTAGPRAPSAWPSWGHGLPSLPALLELAMCYILCFNFKVIVDAQATVRNDAGQSRVPLTHSDGGVGKTKG